MQYRTMTITPDREIDFFVASKIGSFKHIKYHTDSSRNSKKCIENLVDIKCLQKNDGITCMQWGNTEQTEILIGRKNLQIEIFSTVEQSVRSTHPADFGPGHVVGLGRCGDRLVAALSGGTVKVWGEEGRGEELVHAGGKLDVMRVCADAPGVYVTGGEENDVKVWSVERGQATFAGKSVPHDALQLRRPVWVSGAAFARGGGGRVLAVCSRHGYVRLYDTRSQRRPVSSVEFPDMAATCIAPGFDEREFVVGFSRGRLQQVELRAGRPGRGYKGAAGAVCDVTACDTHSHRLLVSVSLDRHLRVHHYTDKRLLYQQYLTSKLSAVLAQTAASTPLRKFASELKEEEAEAEAVEVPDDLDDIFDRMETIGDKPQKMKPEPAEEIVAKKNKPSTEGSTEGTSEDAILQLLRSTEKLKRKREKKKKEKRAKSVFHNA